MSRPGSFDAAAGPTSRTAHVCSVRDGLVQQPQVGYCGAYLARSCAIGGLVVAGFEHSPDPFVEDRIVVVYDSDHRYQGRIRLFAWEPEVFEASDGQCRQVYTGPEAWAPCAWSAYDDFISTTETCADPTLTSCPESCVVDESGVACPP